MNITILGTGFAALTAVKQTRKQAPNASITVIAPKEEFLYYPSLIWIPSGLRKGSDLRINLHNFFNRKHVKFVEASVENVINGGRTVVTSQGEVENDGLIIATGGRFIKKLPGIEHAITPCEGVPAAEKIKERLDGMTGGT
ncbi:MAG TPA: NAD(P)/FAD-dependent oxidoreductase, partial [Thiomicrospira sp.]|nr:NAD(P)/FAD-dependent oxidoreductase [Thiomicrospira sp.]